MRQSAVLTDFDPKRGVSVATLAYEYPSQFHVPEHAHGSDQLIYAVSGIMEVFSAQSVWLIPPHFALWIPARTLHEIRMPGPVSMRTLYLHRGLAAGLESRCAVLHVAPILRELILETVRVGRLRVRNRYEQALRELLIAQIERASPEPTFITLPRDPRALTVAQTVLRDPAHPSTLASLCADAGAGVRTVERLFRKDVGTDFETWRRQVRLTRAVELLVSGCSTKEVAYRIGYRQPSAFVASFRRTFGITPKAWTASLGAQPTAAGRPQAEHLRPLEPASPH